MLVSRSRTSLTPSEEDAFPLQRPGARTSLARVLMVKHACWPSPGSQSPWPRQPPPAGCLPSSLGRWRQGWAEAAPA